jgi:hypothetical protein
MEMTIRRSQIKTGLANRVVINDNTGALSEMLLRTSSFGTDWSSNVDDTTNIAMVTQYAIKQFVNKKITDALAGTEWQDSCLTVTLDSAGLTPTQGARYLITGGVALNDFTGHEEDIAEWDGTAWIFTTPSTGTIVSVDDATNGLYYFGGTTWEYKLFGSTFTAGAGINITTGKIQVDADDAAGIGFTGTGDTRKLAVKVSTGNHKTTQLDSFNGEVRMYHPTGEAEGQVWYWNGTTWTRVDLKTILDQHAMQSSFFGTTEEAPDGTKTKLIMFSDIRPEFARDDIGEVTGITKVYINGVLQQPYTHYTLSWGAGAESDNLEITITPAPEATDIIMFSTVIKSTLGLLTPVSDN